MTDPAPIPPARLFDRIVRTSGLSLLGKVGAKFLGLGHYILLYFFILQAEGYGQFGFILAYVGIFAGLAEGGVTTIFIRQFQSIQDEDERRGLFAGSILLLAIQGFVFWLVCVGFLLTLPWLRTLPENRLVFFFSTVVLFAPSAVCEGIFRARFELKVPVIANLIGYGAFLLLLIPGSPVDTLPEIVIAWWLVTIGRMIWVALLACRVLPPLFAGILGSLGGLFRESAPLFLTRFATYFYYRVDQVMLRAFFPEESAQLGWYLSAVKWTEAANLIPAVLMEGIYPALAKVHRESQEAFRRSVQRVWKVFVAGSGIAVLGLILIFLTVLRFDFARELAPARLSLIVLSVNEGVVFLNLLLFQVLIAAGFQKRLVKVTVSMVFANIFLNAVFFTTVFSRMGHVGAATATLLTEAIGLLFQIGLMGSLLSGTLRWTSLRLLLWLTLATAPVVLFRLSPMGDSGAVWALHLGALVLWGGFSLRLLWGEVSKLKEMFFGVAREF